MSKSWIMKEKWKKKKKKSVKKKKKKKKLKKELLKSSMIKRESIRTLNWLIKGISFQKNIENEMIWNN
mgnify:CR=1 FL=1